MSRQEFTVKNVTCEACGKMISLVLKRFAGVAQVAVDIASGAVAVESAAELPMEQVRAKLAEKGYELV